VLWVYNAILLAAAVVLAPLWLVWVLLSRRLRRGFFQRLLPLPRSPAGTVWVHAASVGEVEAAAPLIGALVERGVPVVATTLTTTGRDRLRARLPGLRVGLAPLDLPGLVHRSLRRAQVGVLVLVETEIWPNTIWAARSAGIPVLIASARVGDSSFKTYRRLRPLFASVLRGVRIAARSAEDRERFVELGVPDAAAQVTGDLKLDRADPAPMSDPLRAALGPGPFLLGGSTHLGEEEALLRAFEGLRLSGETSLRLLLAPRHPERVGQVVATVRRHGFSVGLRSEGAADRDVVVLDTLGELPTIYPLAELVFGGGTLAPVGGHNLIEPVQAGKVVVHGIYTQNQRSQVQLLAPLGVLHPVASAGELTSVIAALWADPERNAPAARARGELDSHRGATDKTLDLLLELRQQVSGA
jgi:3-deoxy-D-manno-octulosonic-acid transferase